MDWIYAINSKITLQEPNVDQFLADVLPILEDYQNIILSTNRIKKTIKTNFVENVFKVARKNNVSSGKWMLFVEEKYVDYIWKIVSENTVNGNLGCSAKVSAKESLMEGEKYLICIYGKEFWDKENIIRILNKIKSLGLYVRCAFKPDCWTYMGVNTAQLQMLRLTSPTNLAYLYKETTMNTKRIKL